MATTTARQTPPPKRPLSTASSPSSAITRGASARSAVPARANGQPSRRTSIRSGTPPIINGANANGSETKESLVASLKHETDHKEQLLVQLENKEQSLLNITKENDQLASSLNAAEIRLSELYADQGRAEDELAARIEVIEKLRTQVRELEKEKRDLHRRYNEQTSTFEAERQSFYDNEQHLKLRIQSLTQARRQPNPLPPSIGLDQSIISEPEPEVDPEYEDQTTQVHHSPKPDLNDPVNEPVEMTALKLELTTLSTSYTSMQNTLVLLQTQLVDLKRVNNELQEENESYNILLREKTLNGQFDLFKQVGGVTSSNNSDQGDDDDSIPLPRDDDAGSLRSNTRSVLDPVDEAPEGGDIDANTIFDLDRGETDSLSSSRRHPSRHSRHKWGSSTSYSPTRGESLANLPITGPGLDLAAELGRAENKDIFEGSAMDDHSLLNGKDKRDKKRSTDRKMSLDGSAARGHGSSGHDIDALRNEVKALKDANKALSLYASKIIDRIISQEGFEHVLAIDYEKEATPTSAGPPPISLSTKLASSPPQASSKQRPQSMMTGRSNSMRSPLMSPTERLTTFESISSPKMIVPAADKTSRRSMSFDWTNFNLFGASTEKKSDPSANLRPLTLKPGGSPIIPPGPRKLDTEEDDDDRRERDRLAATMKLMGIEKPTSPQPPPMEKAQSLPAATPMTAMTSRFSFFRRGSTTTPPTNFDLSANSSVSSAAISSNLNLSKSSLTQEALERAEAENSLAALDAHERSLSAEIAKGSGGGFTEIPRSGRRSRRSGGESGSGSTVWSAGFTD